MRAPTRKVTVWMGDGGEVRWAGGKRRLGAAWSRSPGTLARPVFRARGFLPRKRGVAGAQGRDPGRDKMDQGAGCFRGSVPNARCTPEARGPGLRSWARSPGPRSPFGGAWGGLLPSKRAFQPRGLQGCDPGRVYLRGKPRGWGGCPPSKCCMKRIVPQVCDKRRACFCVADKQEAYLEGAW